MSLKGQTPLGKINGIWVGVGEVGRGAIFYDVRLDTIPEPKLIGGTARGANECGTQMGERKRRRDVTLWTVPGILRRKMNASVSPALNRKRPSVTVSAAGMQTCCFFFFRLNFRGSRLCLTYRVSRDI